jgi:hypothetical protein
MSIDARDDVRPKCWNHHLVAVNDLFGLVLIRLQNPLRFDFLARDGDKREHFSGLSIVNTNEVVVLVRRSDRSEFIKYDLYTHEKVLYKVFDSHVPMFTVSNGLLYYVEMDEIGSECRLCIMNSDFEGLGCIHTISIEIGWSKPFLIDYDGYLLFAHGTTFLWQSNWEEYILFDREKIIHTLTFTADFLQDYKLFTRMEDLNEKYINPPSVDKVYRFERDSNRYSLLRFGFSQRAMTLNARCRESWTDLHFHFC